MTSTPCAPFESLVAYHEAAASGLERRRIARHLAAGCARCQEQLDWIEAVGTTLGETPPDPVPEGLVRRAQALGKTAPVPLVARLAALALVPAAAGLRGGALGERPHLRYEAGEYRIDLQTEEVEDRGTLRGLLSRDRAPCDPREVRLVPQAPGAAIAGTLREGGAFQFSRVPAGEYALHITTPHTPIEVRHLVL